MLRHARGTCKISRSTRTKPWLTSVDPEGDFVEAIGRNFTADQAAKVIADHVKDWEKPLKKETRWE
jgi:rRNA processing protein Krr1/Pno1